MWEPGERMEREPLEPLWENEEEPDFEKEYWDEYDWERMFALNDRKVDELIKFEKVFHDSDMKSRDLELLGYEECDHNCPDCGKRHSCWEFQEKLAAESREATGTPEPIDREEYQRENFRESPLYRLCFDFGMRVHDFLKPYREEQYDEDPALLQLAENWGIPGAKIAGASAFGLRPDSIGGNIANCKRAATALSKCVEALGKLSERPECGKEAEELRRAGQEALCMLHARIEELRVEARRLWGLEP